MGTCISSSPNCPDSNRNKNIVGGPMSDKEQVAVRPSRIEVRTKSLTDSNFLELREFYRNKQKVEKSLVVKYKREASAETQNYIQIDFYNKEDTQIDGVMVPYKE